MCSVCYVHVILLLRTCCLLLVCVYLYRARALVFVLLPHPHQTCTSMTHQGWLAADPTFFNGSFPPHPTSTFDLLVDVYVSTCMYNSMFGGGGGGGGVEGGKIMWPGLLAMNHGRCVTYH